MHVIHAPRIVLHKFSWLLRALTFLVSAVWLHIARVSEVELKNREREGCWLKGPCRRAGRVDAGNWELDVALDRYGLGWPLEEERRCLNRAQQLWVLCENVEADEVVSHYSLTGSQQSFPSIGQTAKDQWGQLEAFAHYTMTHQWKPSVNQFSDADVAPPLRDCDFDNGVDWNRVRSALDSAVGYPPDLLNEADVPWENARLNLDLGCRKQLLTIRSALGEFANPSIGAWAISDATSDCFLGMLSLRLFELLCRGLEEVQEREGSFGSQEYFSLMDDTMIRLEGFFFHMQQGGDPAGGAFETLARTSWPVVNLLEGLGQWYRQNLQPLMLSLCDQRDEDNDVRLKRALLLHFNLSELQERKASDAASDWRILAAEPRPPWAEGAQCAWRHVCLHLAIAAEHADVLAVASSETPVIEALQRAEHWFRAWDVAAEPAEVPLMSSSSVTSRLPVPPRRQFFYDLLSSSWPVFAMLQRVRLQLLRRERILRSTEALQSSVKSGAASVARQSALFHCVAKKCQEQLFEDTRLPPNLPLALFLGGGENTPQWTAFSLRGRQVARMLRIHLRWNAQVWQQPCESFCEYLRGVVLVRNTPDSGGEIHAVEEAALRPHLLVHIKFVCGCAVRLLPDSKHVLDVVDNSQWINSALSGDDGDVDELDAVIVESRDAAMMLAGKLPTSNPKMRFFSLPHGVSIAHEAVRPRSSAESLKPVRLLVVHTSHQDPVYERVQAFLDIHYPAVHFAQWRPSRLFGGSGNDVAGRLISPPQLRRVQAQLTSIDLTFVKQSGCLSEPEFCRLFKPGQRLLHAWAAGVPTVVVLGNSSGLQSYLGEDQYPRDVLVNSDGCENSTWTNHPNGSVSARVFCDAADSSELLAALDKALRNGQLRASMQEANIERARRWAPAAFARMYALALREVG